jgi:protein TonB
MKKNNIFLSMLGLSAALHGLILFGMAGDGFRAEPPAPEKQFAQTLKMIKVGTRPQKAAPGTPIEKESVEQFVEPMPEIPSIVETEETGETVSRETALDDGGAEEGDGGHDEEARENGAGDGETMTDREYEALLAYIKYFIEKNLVYPTMARRRNVEGVVGVSFEIERGGGIAAIAVNHSSGSSILDNAAMSLVNRIRLLENVTIKRKLVLRVNIEYKLTE